MISIKHLLPFVRCQVWLGSFFLANVISWDAKNRKFIPTNYRHPKIIASALLVLIYNIVVFYRMSGIIADKVEDGGGFINNVIAIMILMAVATGDWKGWLALRKSDQVAEFYSRMIQFEEKEFNEDVVEDMPNLPKWNLLAKLRYGVTTYLKWIRADIKNKAASRVIMTAACYSLIMMPSCIVAFIIISPCSTPSFLRSTLSDCPKRGGFPSLKSTIPLKILCLLMDGFATAYGVCQGATAIASYFYVGVVCLRSYVTRIKEELEQTKGKIDVIKKRVEAYKRAKLLEKFYNQINESGIVPVIMFDMANLSIMSIAVLIAQHESLSIPQLILILVIATDSAIFIQFSMYQAAGEVYQRSSAVRSLWEHNMIIQKDKYLRRYVKACNSIKVRMGSSGNFMEKDTPLICTQFTMEQAISLVILTNEK